VVLWLLLRWRRNGVADATVLGRYFVLAGSIRFAIEFVRINRQIAGPLTLAQLISASVAIVGIVLLTKRTDEPRASTTS
jgi:prolipoprotein diacylglyceryltransferase